MECPVKQKPLHSSHPQCMWLYPFCSFQQLPSVLLQQKLSCLLMVFYLCHKKQPVLCCNGRNKQISNGRGDDFIKNSGEFLWNSEHDVWMGWITPGVCMYKVWPAFVLQPCLSDVLLQVAAWQIMTAPYLAELTFCSICVRKHIVNAFL